MSVSDFVTAAGAVTLAAIVILRIIRVVNSRTFASAMSSPSDGEMFLVWTRLIFSNGALVIQSKNRSVQAIGAIGCVFCVGSAIRILVKARKTKTVNPQAPPSGTQGSDHP